MKRKLTKTDVVEQYCKKYPNHGNLTIARVLINEEPELFLTLESARTLVRTVRGSGGSDKKTSQRVASLEPTNNRFAAIPEGKASFDDWQPYTIKGDHTIGVISDIHIPYHVPSVVRIILNKFYDAAADTIILNGDTADFFSVSFWEKDPRKRDLNAEIETVRTFLEVVRENFPSARIIFKIGNHEERWERFLSVKAPELLGVPDFQLSKILRFDDLGIEEVGEKRPIKAGKLFVIHGHEFKFGICSPVNPARGFYMRAKEHVIGGHLHQSSSHCETSINGTVVSAWSTGCACDLHPDYSPLNKWNHGAAIVTLQKDGNFEVDNFKVINNKIYNA